MVDVEELATPSAPPLPVRRGESLEQRLVILMAARLVLAVVSLGIALSIDTVVGELSAGERRGLFGTVALAFLATAAYGIVLPRIRRRSAFAAVNIATDIAMVTALVHFSGGAHSVFTFLYVLVAVYGALLFERRGALGSACLGVLAYAGVVLAGHLGGGGEESAREPGPVLFMIWAVHAGAIVLVAALASFLAGELQRTGEALLRSRSDLQRLRSLHQRTVESLMSGLLTTDLEARVTSFNPEAERITGLSVGAALDCDVEEILPGVRQLCMDRAGDGATVQSRARMRYRNTRGEALHLGAAAYVLRDVDGIACGHVVIFQDVSDVVEMEHELRRSERMAAVGQLSASIAHEIRNPLASISGSIQILRGRETAPRGSAGEGDEAGRLMDIVLREVDRLNQLITDFLRYARPGALHREAVSLREAVGEVLEMFESGRPASVRVAMEVGEGLAVHADAAQLRQVLWNLVLNASQAMPRGGRLEIAACSAVADAPQEALSGRRNEVEKAGWVEIFVSDEGEGIPPEMLDRIFDPFFTTKPEGSGLGLATVHRIVEEHGGSIRLESSLNRGTTIRLRLPRMEIAG